MPFTTTALAAQMNDPNLATWASSAPATQGPLVAGYIAYFNGLMTWIMANGGTAQFGTNDIAGFTTNAGAPVQWVPNSTLIKHAILDDSFNQVRHFMNTPGFRLYQAAEANQRMINNMAVFNT